MPTALRSALLREVAERLSVDEDLAGVELVEAREQIHERRFSRAGVADERDRFAGPRVQRDVVQHRQLLVVGKAHVLKTHVARDLHRLVVLHAARLGGVIEISKTRSPAARPACTSWLS